VDRSARAHFDLIGLGDEILAGLRYGKPSPAEWESAFPLQVGGRDREKPAMSGQYALLGDTVRFTPSFNLLPGVDYVATADLERLAQIAGCFHRPHTPTLTIHTFISPTRTADPSVVMRVYPTADSLPANLLKFYIYF